MSLRVLVIPEDPTHNGYILKPLFERMMSELGKPHAKVTVLTNPRMMGYDHAVKAIRGPLADIWGHHDLWLFCPDSDVASGLDELEQELAGKNIVLRCCAANPEVEAWLLAGHHQKIGVPWASVATHHRLKEEVFEPFLFRHGDQRSVGQGRAGLMLEAVQNYDGLLARCPELKELQDKLELMNLFNQ